LFQSPMEIIVNKKGDRQKADTENLSKRDCEIKLIINKKGQNDHKFYHRKNRKSLVK
jgi:hypothetical protein